MTLIAFALCAPMAQADTSYGGAAVRNGAQNGPAITCVTSTTVIPWSARSGIAVSVISLISSSAAGTGAWRFL